VSAAVGAAEIRSLARSLGAGRALMGVSLIVAPRLVGASWVGPAVAGAPGGRVLARAMGMRDLVLGVAALRSAEAVETDPRAVARTQLGLAACDAADLLATLAASRSLPPAAAPIVAAVAGAAIAAELWTAMRLSRGG
jgi:hypothetical protein